jgi:hypothetical protein
MPNDTPVAATGNNAVPSMDSIAEKMAAMRNQIQATRQTETGSSEQATTEAPVAPTTDAESVEPEIDSPQAEVEAQAADDGLALEAVEPEQDNDTEVSDTEASDTTAQDIIDFVEFAESNPNAKFKFMKNGKEMIIDAKKAAAILGQGGAIHEEARQLKIEKAEFDEYLREQKSQQEGLTLAMEFTVAPQLQRAYDEILKTQQYNQVFLEQLQRTQDPAEQAKIQANIQQNERYMAQQGNAIRNIKPKVDQFRELRKQQVQGLIESNRKAFKDKELKNEYVFNELREKLSKTWSAAQSETLPGVKNLDLITSDETILGLIRDGLKYRDKPAVKQAGNSIAALTSKQGRATPAPKNANDDINKLREQARSGDKKAADNLLVAQLNKLRATRK